MAKRELLRKIDQEPGGGMLGSGLVSGVAGDSVQEGPGIDVIGAGRARTVGLGGDTILLYDSAGAPVAEFAATGGGAGCCAGGCDYRGCGVVAGVRDRW